VILSYLSPLCVVIIAIIWRKAIVTRWQWLAYGFAFLGVLIANGGINFFSRLESLYGIIGAICTAIALNVVRSLHDKEPPETIILFFPLLSLPLSALGCLFSWKTPNLHEISWLLTCSLFAYIGQYYVTKALTLETASKIAIISYLSLPLSFLCGVLFFEEPFSASKLFAVFLILGSLGFAISLRSEQPEN
jgi:drug/metabolite transporter (DMT)-like permease